MEIGHNNLLLMPYVVSDKTQMIRLVAYKYRDLYITSTISIAGILRTLDNKFIICHRRTSFLYSTIQYYTKDRYKKQNLFKRYSKYLSNAERTILSYELSLPNRYSVNHIDFILPGGKLKQYESIIECLLREVKEEINIEDFNVVISRNCFVHGIIYDRLINKPFETIILYANINLTSHQILDNFIPNCEIDNISFITYGDIKENNIYSKVIPYVLQAIQLR